MKHSNRIIALAIIALVLVSSACLSAVPPMISYQGKLMQPNGTSVPDGSYSIRFAIYDAPTGGNTLWSEINPSVQVKGGLFAVLLGSVNNLGANILDSQDRYLGIKVGSDAELAPRQRIASVATALRAGEADVAKTVLDGAITTAKVAPAAITADKLAPGVAVPPGTILMWSGAVNAIPQGWVLCNGQNGTPDLRNRFVVGAADEYAVAATGGEKQHQLTVAEMPSHNHRFERDPIFWIELTSGYSFLRNGDSTTDARVHDNTELSGGDQPHENRPPYYALCFIMKQGY